MEYIVTKIFWRQFQFFQLFKIFQKKKKIIKVISFNFSMRLLRYFFKNLKKIFAPQNIEKLHSKVAHNPTRPPVFSPASFFFVKLRQF